MSHQYKKFNQEQLIAEEHALRRKLLEAEQANRPQHIAINKRKIEIVQSYMLCQEDFKVGEVRRLKEDPTLLFKIDEMSGVIAWGFHVNKLHEHIKDEREALLIILLGDKVE